MKKRILSALLAVCLVVGMVPATLLTASAADQEISGSVSLAIGSNYSSTYGTITAGTPFLPQAGLDVNTANVSISSFSTTNYDYTNNRTTGGSYYTAGSVPYIKVTVKADSGYKFASGASVSLTSWTSVGDQTVASNGSTITAAFVQTTTNLSVISQTVAFTDATGTEKASDPTPTIAVGETYAWKPYATYTDYNSVTRNSTASFTYTSSNSKVATASASGIKGVGEGTATITITAKEVSGLLDVGTLQVTVTVKDNNKLAITGDSSVTYSVDGNSVADATLGLGVNVTGDGEPGSYTWTSSNPDVVSFDSPTVTNTTQTAKANNVGTATITVKAYSGNSGDGALLGTATKTVTVKPLEVLTPKANDVTVPYADASSAINQSSLLTPFFRSYQHLAADGTTSAKSNEYYKLTGKPTSNASTYQITATLLDPDNTVWEGTTSSAPLTFTVKVTAKAITDINTTVDSSSTLSVTYTGKTAEPKFVLKTDSSITLVEGQDFTMSTSEIYVKSDAVATITGINNYTGTMTEYFNITANTGNPLSVNKTLYATKGSSVDLRKAVLSAASDINVNNLSGLTFTLGTDSTSKALGTLNGYTLKIDNTAGNNAQIKVKVSLPTTSYNVGGSSAPEYTNLSISSTEITITVTNAVKTVTVPTAKTGLVYNGKTQIGVADGQYYNVLATEPQSDYTAPGGNYVFAASGKNVNASELYYSVIALDQSDVTDGSILTWADGTSGYKIVFWSIARAKITGDITFTEIKADGYTLADVGRTGYFYDVNGSLFEITSTTTTAANQAELKWVAGTSTAVVKDATYAWELVPHGWNDTPASNTANYEKVTGSVVLYGEAEEEEEDEDDWETTVTNADGSVTVTKYDGETKETVATTTGAYTTSVVTYKNGVLSSITATSTRAGAMAYVPLNSGYVRWDSLVYVNNAVEQDALPADGLTGMYVPLPVGASTLRVTTDGYIFSDVSVGSYFGPSVYIASSRNLIQGTSTTSFVYSPTYTLLRGQVMTILGRYSGAVSMASSTGTNWYAPGVQWALSTGVATENRYSDNASREEMAVMLYNHYRNVLGGAAYTGSSAAYAFTDYNSISAGARTAVAWCYANGIIEGNSTNLSVNTFAPQATILRRDAACMAARYLYVVNGLPIPSAIA